MLAAAIAFETSLMLSGRMFTIGEEEKHPPHLALAAGEISEANFSKLLREDTSAI